MNHQHHLRHQTTKTLKILTTNLHQHHHRHQTSKPLTSLITNLHRMLLIKDHNRAHIHLRTKDRHRKYVVSLLKHSTEMDHWMIWNSTWKFTAIDILERHGLTKTIGRVNYTSIGYKYYDITALSETFSKVSPNKIILKNTIYIINKKIKIKK